MKRKRFSLLVSLLIILGSTLVVSGSATATLFFYQHHRIHRTCDDRFLIRTIVQTGPRAEALPTDTLAQLIGLSSDQPTNLYALDLQEARWKLCNHPLVTEARLARLRPHSLYIDYTLREPVARLTEYPSVGVDAEGRLFPLLDQGEELVELHLGMPPGLAEPWSHLPPQRPLRQALHLLTYLSDQTPLQPLRIDTEHSLAQSLGERQVVLVLREGPILRLPVRGVEEAIERYLTLSPQLPVETQVVDLRLKDLAYLSG